MQVINFRLLAQTEVTKCLVKKITLIMNQNIGTDVVFAICSKASLISNEPEPWQLTDGVGAQLSLRDIS